MKEDGEIKRDERGEKRTKTGPSKNRGNVCDVVERKRGRYGRKWRKRERKRPTPAGASSSSNRDQ